MVFTIITTQYQVGADPVVIYAKQTFGVTQFSTTQTALTARTSGGTGMWGDNECLAEVTAQLAAQYPGAGHTAALNA